MTASLKYFEDAGEKLGGARKDQLHHRSANDDRKPSITLTEIWERPDFESDARNGRCTPQHAASFLSYYDSLSRTPNTRFESYDYWVKAYRSIVETLKSAYENGFESELEQITDKLNTNLQRIGPSVSSDILYVAGKTIGSRRIAHPLAFNLESNLTRKYLVSMGWPNDARVGKLGRAYGVIEIIPASRSDNEVYLPVYASKNRYWTLGRPCKTESEAIRVARAAIDSELAQQSNKNQSPLSRNRKNVKRPVPPSGAFRTGTDWRRGQSVSQELFMKTFRYRAIEYGNWVTQEERQQSINDAFDASMDLCQIMGLSPAVISFAGRMAIAFGSRGRGYKGGSAHFEMEKWIFHFTKTSGVGAYAHEFAHGLDAYLALRNRSHPALDGQRFISSHAMTNPKSLLTEQNGMIDGPAVSNLIDLFDAVKRSKCYYRSVNLDIRRPMRYWSQPTELFARIFESWVNEKLLRAGLRNDFLVYGVDSTNTALSWGFESNPYPEDSERDLLFEKMEQFVFRLVSHWKELSTKR